MSTKFQEFWSRITLANPGFGGADSTKVTMTIGTVRKLLARAHKDGFHNGLSISKSLEKLNKEHRSREDLIDRLKRKSGQS